MLPIDQSTYDGGWVEHPAGVATTFLRYPQRNHAVQPRSMGAGSEDRYVLPPGVPHGAGPWAATLGMHVPIGTVVWVHNVSTVGGVARVVTEDGATVSTFSAGESQSFILTAASNADYGTWRRFGAGLTNHDGPTHIGDYQRFILEINRSQNDVHVLREAVAQGYDGTDPTYVLVVLRGGLMIGGEAQNYSLDMGGDVAINGINWNAVAWFRLVVEVGSVIGGRGGNGGGGGIGGTGANAGVAGFQGWHAVRAPRNLEVENRGTIQAGGGGGGGGSTSVSLPGVHAGGGGGGAGVRVQANGYVVGGNGGYGSGANTRQATPGSTGRGGVAGLGATVTPDVGGVGGYGGDPGQNGGPGYGHNAGPAGQPGGAAGAAFSRAAGATITFVPGATGIVTGATIVE